MPVGERLAEERRKRGRTLQEIAAETRIVPHVLEALEHGRYEELPSPAYMRGHIRSYAKALGLDPTPFIEEYERDTGAQSHVEVRLDALPERSVVPLRDQIHSIPKRAWVGLAAGLIVLGVVVWGIGTLGRREPVVPPMPPAETSSAAEATAAPSGPAVILESTSSPPAADPSVPATGPAPGAAFALRVAVAPGGASWLRVTVDGELAYEGTLTGPSEKAWTVSSEATVRVGRPSVVTVTRDGTPVALSSADGIAQATITAPDE